MTMTSRQYSKQLITGLTNRTKQLLDDGWQGYLTTFMFNQLRGGLRQVNHQMQIQVEGMYASFLTRLNRRPDTYGAVLPRLIGCPDWPVPKDEKKPLTEVLINDGLHYHGILLVSPEPARLRTSIEQHFVDEQEYYVRDRILNRIDVRPFANEHVCNVTDYALKGLKTNRLPDEETLVILPKDRLETSARPYLARTQPEKRNSLKPIAF